MTIKDIAVMVGVLVGIYANLVFQDSLAAGADDYDLTNLRAPSADLLQREQQMSVTIFDGIEVTEVDRALDSQFERIDSMMFVRIRHPQPDGDYDVDDDCD